MASDYHSYEPIKGHRLKHDPLMAIIGPRPIGWISSQDTEGRLNLAPFSFFNMLNRDPPIIGFSPHGRKDSLCNVEATGSFVWNLATRPLAEAMNRTSAAVPPDVDEFALSGLTPLRSDIVAPPRVAESPVSFECKMTQIVVLRDVQGEPTRSRLVLGQVVAVHICRALLVDGIYNTALARPILRGGGTSDYFEVLQEGHFQMVRPD